MASIELALLGDSIVTTEAVNSEWLRQKVKRAKKEDPGTHAGALFELLMAGPWHRPGRHDLLLPSADSPGYDIGVRFPDAEVLHLSIRRHGSFHVADFHRRSRELETALRNRWPASSPVQVFALNRRAYPDSSSWTTLTSGLDNLIRTSQFGAYAYGDWSVLAYPQASENADFYLGRLSYTLIVAVPFHVNEESNLRSKLDGAFANMRKNLRDAERTRRAGLFVRIPAEIPLDAAVAWSQRLLEDTTEHAGLVIPYQPALVTNLERDTTSLVHASRPCLRPDTRAWLEERGGLSVRYLVGVPQEAGSHQQLMVGDQVFPLNGLYLFQSGHHYYRAARDGDGYRGTIRYSSGIQSHLLFEDASGEAIEFSGHFPPNVEPLIL